MIIIFGYFFLRRFCFCCAFDVKLKFWLIDPIGAWVLLMRFFDQWFNTGPAIPQGRIHHQPCDSMVRTRLGFSS